MAAALPLLTWLQFALLALLAVYGLHRGWMGWFALRCRWEDRGPKTWLDPGAQGDALPRVTLQLPIFNERYVATRLLDAALALDWPRDRLQIQVLDDSTDDTTELIREHLATRRALAGDNRADVPPDPLPDVAHIRRTDRSGFKAGALAFGLSEDCRDRATGDYVAIFDADFVPPSDFLHRMLPAFQSAPSVDDPAGIKSERVGLVQARWEHLNADRSTLTRVQALLLDGHFAVEHLSRARRRHMFNFNGTAGVFRRDCLEQTGWEGDTLTEDMDLSYRAQLSGWRFRYRPDVACPAELPTEMGAFLKQQHRWAKGGIQTARKNLRQVWRSPLPLAARLEAALHLLSNCAFPILLALVLVSLPLQLARHAHGAVDGVVHGLEATVLGLSTLAVLFTYGVAQFRLGRLTPTRVLQLPLVLVVGAGLALNNTLAVFSGLGRNPGVFTRTPKRGATEHSVYRSPRGWLPVVEWGLGCWALTTAALALSLGLYATTVFHGLFACGLLWTGGASIWQALQKGRRVARGASVQKEGPQHPGNPMATAAT